MLGTLNLARILLPFFRLKKEGLSGEDKEMNSQNAQKTVYKTPHKKYCFNPKFTLINRISSQLPKAFTSLNNKETTRIIDNNILIVFFSFWFLIQVVVI